MDKGRRKEGIEETRLESYPIVTIPSLIQLGEHALLTDPRTGRLGSLYLVSYLDRGNVGNAYTAGLGSGWGITSDGYSWIVTILYIGYILFHWVSCPS